MANITETNQQYYQGAQQFIADGSSGSFTTTFDTDLVFGSYDPTENNYMLNNFKLYTSATGLPGSFIEYIASYTVSGNTINISSTPANGTYFVVQLKSLDGGNYGNGDAYGDAVENNYGSYEYIKLGDAIDNFMVGYVGDGKIIQKAKKSDIVFFAKRSLQEFSYDTLKSVNSQELTIPPSLSLAIPQDYVNYVQLSWVDSSGVKHIIYPTTLTSNPTQPLLQNTDGIPEQDNTGENLESQQAKTDARWASNNNLNITGQLTDEIFDQANVYDWSWWKMAYGERYGLEPQVSQKNGWFTINEREGKFSFSSGLANQLIILEYISDGLAYDSNTKVPKMAEEALYAHIMHSMVASRANFPEYIVQRYKRERSAKLRNAKIRLSNIKLEEFTQVMRGKSKWIKH